jgi:hypothetical protein
MHQLPAPPLAAGRGRRPARWQGRGGAAGAASCREARTRMSAHGLQAGGQPSDWQPGITKPGQRETSRRQVMCASEALCHPRQHGNGPDGLSSGRVGSKVWGERGRRGAGGLLSRSAQQGAGDASRNAWCARCCTGQAPSGARRALGFTQKPRPLGSRAGAGRPNVGAARRGAGSGRTPAALGYRRLFVCAVWGVGAG